MTTPTNKDVLLGRGGGTNTHAGNVFFRSVVAEFQPQYIHMPKTEKSSLSRTIVRKIRDLGGRFLRKEKGCNEWVVVGEAEAVSKTSQALREGMDVRRQAEKLPQKPDFFVVAGKRVEALSDKLPKRVAPIVASQEEPAKNKSPRGSEEDNDDTSSPNVRVSKRKLSDGEDEIQINWHCEGCGTRGFGSKQDAFDHAEKCDSKEKPGGSLAEANNRNGASTTGSIGVGGASGRWRCDVCKIAFFPSYEEAAAHEAECSSQKSYQAVPPQVIASSTVKTLLNEREPWFCDICKIASFSTYEKAAAHEATCVGAGTTPDKGKPLETGSMEEKWRCDICKDAAFSSYEEASAHESTCTGAK